LISSKLKKIVSSSRLLPKLVSVKICALTKVTQSLLQLSLSVYVPNRPKLEKERKNFVTFANIRKIFKIQEIPKNQFYGKKAAAAIIGP